MRGRGRAPAAFAIFFSIVNSGGFSYLFMCALIGWSVCWLILIGGWIGRFQNVDCPPNPHQNRLPMKYVPQGIVYGRGGRRGRA